MGLNAWEKTRVRTTAGEKDAIAPVIISASRATDVPAFYPVWLMERLKAGYVKWVNPFNHKEQYVSFEKTRAIVFWTKNARPMFKYLDALDSLGINYYFTFTVNDYFDEGLEPGLPALVDRLETFRDLSQRTGKGRWSGALILCCWVILSRSGSLLKGYAGLGKVWPDLLTNL